LPPGPSQADQTATRRAIASLADRALIDVESGTVRIYPGDAESSDLLSALERKYLVLRRAKRTPLGEQVATHYRDELESGGRIRWTAGKLDLVIADTMAGCPRR
jgi:hypothetical protein